MAEAKLPEEIIREILTLILPPFCAKTFLKFPLESRRPCWAQERPGALEEGGTNVLLISKRWLRIATPLLYQGVALRKSRHTSAVARLVKADPAVGRAIRYLRLEGGSMTRELSTLVKHAPNIHTVYVSEQMRTGESLDGLQRAMSLLRPTTLYIHLLAQTLHNWRAVREDEIALKAVVEVWPSIAEVHFSDSRVIEFSWSNVLRKTPSLRELHTPTASFAHNDTWCHRTRYWHTDGQKTPLEWIADNPTFEKFVFHGEEHRDSIQAILKQAHLSAVAKLVTYVDDKD